MELRNYKVYIHITPSKKYYVGITKQSLSRRWRSGKGYNRCTYFNLAIQKYGWDNIEHEVIATNITEKEAKNFEILLIKKLKSNNRDFGYNITSGGDGCHGTKCSEERKKLLSIKMSGSGNHMYNIHLKGMCGKDNPMYGKQSATRKKVLCLTTNELFDCVTDGAIKYKTYRSDINKVCNGKRPHAGKLSDGTKLVWRYVNGD